MTLAHLCLGTASWNTETPYNGKTPPSDDEVARILDVAEAGGIRWIDTAAAYGDVEERLHGLTKDAKYITERFRVVTKRQLGGPSSLFNFAAFELVHLKPDESGYLRHPLDGLGLHGSSVYSVGQATAALDAGVQALQVPWSGWSVENWTAVRDRAYADGVLFFGRQPFGPHGEGLVVDEGFRRDAFAYALTTNPRGWCVVGVETAAQVEELCAWRAALLP